MLETERRGLWLMAAPFLVGVAVLVVLPAGLTLVMSTFEWDLVQPPRFVWLDNFRELLRDDVFRLSLRNSLQYVLFAVPLRLVLAVSLGLLLAGRARGAGPMRAAIFSPAVIPDVAYALLWIWILNPLYGPLNLALGALGLPDAVLAHGGHGRAMGRDPDGPVPDRGGVPDRGRGPPRDPRRAVRPGRRAGRGARRPARADHAPVDGAGAAPARRARHRDELPVHLRAGARGHGRRSAAVPDDLPPLVRLPQCVRVPAVRIRLGRHDA